MVSTTEKVNKVYIKNNPSLYLRNFKLVDKFVQNRINLLMSLKLPKNIFKDSNLIDFGSGTGLNTLVYNILGANCTLIEYDKKSYQFSKKLFKKFSKTGYRIIKKDLFNFKTKKKFDFVISNGVAHHTKNPILNLKICVKSLKKNGFFLFGFGETNGFFQRNLQRLILYSLSNNYEDIANYAKILFKDHLNRSKKFSGRTIDEIIADTYLNPKINTLSLNQLIEFFRKNNLEIYSYYGKIKSLNNFIESDINQFKLTNSNKKQKKNEKINLNLNDIQNFSLSNNYFEKSQKLIYKKINSLNIRINKFTSSINNIDFNKKNIKLHNNSINDLHQKIKHLDKIDLINKNHNLKFIQELKALIKILNSNNINSKKLQKIKKHLSLCKVLLKGVNGTGMNYLVGYKK